MDLFKVIMLSSWNSISGPKIEQLWFPDSHPIFKSNSDVKWNVNGYDIPKNCVLPLIVQSTKASSKYRSTKKSSQKSESKDKADSSAGSDFINCTLLDIKKCLSMSGKLLITEIESKKGFSENSSRLYCLEKEIMFSVVFHKRPWLDRKTNVESHCSCISILLSCETFPLTYDIHRIIDIHLRKVVAVLQRSVMSPSTIAKDVSNMVEDICEVIYAIKCNTPNSIHESMPRLFQQFQPQMKFLSRAITSHIQTCGYSVVNGDSALSINQIAKILSLFNNEQERQYSEANLKVARNLYRSGLHVQAILKGQDDAILPSVVFRDCPVSFIDTDWCKVRQTVSESTSEKSSNVLKTVTNSGTLVPQLLDDLIFFEENNSDVRGLVGNFCKNVMVKALALIKIIEDFRAEGRTPTEKKLIVLLNVRDVADLHLCFGYAEKIKPGIRTALAS